MSIHLLASGIRQSGSALLLDLVGGASAAYSTARKLRTGYSGSALRVRRSSDNGEQDIGFNADGTLDESALTTFVGANDGFVAKWYDQSGNARDLTQATAGDQWRIVNSGTVEKVNGKPVAKVIALSQFLSIASASLTVAQPLTIYTLALLNDLTRGAAVLWDSDTGSNQSVLDIDSIGDKIHVGFGTFTDTGITCSTAVRKHYAHKINGGALDWWIDGSKQPQLTGVGTNGFSGLTVSNARSGFRASNAIQGSVTELALYPALHADATVGTVQTDQRDFYADY